MVTSSDVKWVKYGPRRGPWFSGVHEYVLPEMPDDNDRYVAVITAAESGHYDAVNMYDRAVVSVGIIQWIEGTQHSFSDLLGAVAERLGIDYVVSRLQSSLSATGSRFEKLHSGKWRFVFNDERGEVDDIHKVQQLFLGCDGNVASWRPDLVALAKGWCSNIASIWDDPVARRVQLDFTKSRLSAFVMPKARSLLFSWSSDDRILNATRAMYMQFAINNPNIANLVLITASAATSDEPGSHAWCVHIVKHLALRSPISEWSTRYSNVRAAVESVYGVRIPKLNDLQGATSFEIVPSQRSTMGQALEPVQDNSSFGMVESTVQPTSIKPEQSSITAMTAPSGLSRLIAAVVGFFKIMVAFITVAMKDGK